VFVAGIAGIIAATINGNNAGVVLSIGLAIVLAAIALLTVSAVGAHERIDAFDDAAGENLERLVAALVADGADEAAVRAVVREARRLGVVTSRDQ
jgi:ABC-type nickel/cobalt efflux system permease component RcnA